MSTVNSGVFPVYEHEFAIGDTGSGAGNPSEIAGLETVSISIDNGIEEWRPFENEGWIERLQTAKGFTLTFTGKRVVGDAGNDMIARLAFSNGAATKKKLNWAMPDGQTLVCDVVISVTNIGGGDSTNVAPLEFQAMSSGKPTITP